MDRIAVGGEENKVDIHNVSNGEVTSESLQEPYLAMQFQSTVQRIQWHGKYVIGYSEDSHASIYNTESEKVIHAKPGHEGSIKNGAMDPLGEYFATSGCDG